MMMLHKPLVSFIAAFALASGIAVSATPVARGNYGGDYPPPSATPVTVSECDTGSMSCCDTYTSTSNPNVGLLSGLLGLTLNPALGVGLNCLPILLSSIQCDNTPVCCDNVQQTGLINMGCSPLNLGL